MTDASAEQTKTVNPQVTRHENFESWYANNVQFDQTDFDLKMIFGEGDLSKMIVQKHTAMTVSWIQAKIMLYFLTLQFGIYEMTHPKIQVPINVLPPESQPPTGEAANDPMAQLVHEYINKMRAQFIESLK